MTTISARSGGALRRRLFSCAANSAVDADAITAACHRSVRPLALLSGATTAVARSSSLPYVPRVDIVSPAILCPKLRPPTSSSLPCEPQLDLVTLRRPGLLTDGSRTLSGSSSAPHEPQIDPPTLRRLDVLTDGSRTTSGSSSALHELQIDPATLRRLDVLTDGSRTTSALHELQETATLTMICSTASISGVRHTIASPTSTPFDTQTIGGLRKMPSMANPCGRAGKEILTRAAGPSIIQARRFSARTSEDEKPDARTFEKDVLDRLDTIDSKVGNVDEKVDSIHSKMDGMDVKINDAISNCANLSNEVELLKGKQQESGDWTSFRIKGKNLNWLSVGSALWELVKAFFK